MKKIKEILIHWLGGYTEEEYLEKGVLAWNRGFTNSLQSAKFYADGLYGLSAEEWSEKMYKYITDCLEK